MYPAAGLPHRHRHRHHRNSASSSGSAAADGSGVAAAAASTSGDRGGASSTIDDYSSSRSNKSARVGGGGGITSSDGPPPPDIAAAAAVAASHDKHLSNAIWDAMFRCLLQFKFEYGHLRVPLHYESLGRKVGAWVHQQQKEWCPSVDITDADSMNRFNKLKCIGLDLDPDWNRLFDELVLFQHDYQHTRVPVDYKHNNHSLGFWVSELRREYRSVGGPGLTNAIAIERFSKLKRIGLTFDPDWQNMFDGLKEFWEKHNHCNVPANKKLDNGRNLSHWVFEQRWLFLVYPKISSLTISQDLIDDRITMLESINFDFALPKEQRIKFQQVMPIDVDNPVKKIAIWDSGIEMDPDELWDQMYTGLILFKDIKGNLSVRDGTFYNGESLSDWVKEQAILYGKAKSTKSTSKGFPRSLRIAKLDAIGFDSISPLPTGKKAGAKAASSKRTVVDSADHNQPSWEEMHLVASQYLRQHGHLAVPKSFLHRGHDLGAWIEHQCKLLRERIKDPHNRENPLSPDQAIKLTALGVLQFIPNE